MAPFVHTLRVRYHECDAQGIVFNAQYFAYFDIAMTELWRAAFERSYATMIADHGIDMVVAEATARFLGSARFDDLVDLEAQITRLGTTGITTRMRVLRAGELLVEGELRHVFVDATSWTSTPMPTAVRSALGRFAAPS
ncbi:MAG TPA: thioesterase family protein [Solirubrobacteraceae bacterium]|nr:thioesterase family protein [Solirubrobacteraceae bacterium]